MGGPPTGQRQEGAEEGPDPLLHAEGEALEGMVGEMHSGSETGDEEEEEEEPPPWEPTKPSLHHQEHVGEEQCQECPSPVLEVEPDPPTPPPVVEREEEVEQRGHPWGLLEGMSYYTDGPAEESPDEESLSGESPRSGEDEGEEWMDYG